MNLDELKQSWDKLSERLEREEVIRREELRLDGIHLLGSERGWGGDIHRKPLLGA